MSDPYDHVREAFHTVADGLMGWNDPPERAVRRSNGTEASYRHEDITALENAGEALIRAGCYSEAVALFALALRVRMSLDG